MEVPSLKLYLIYKNDLNWEISFWNFMREIGKFHDGTSLFPFQNSKRSD